MRTLERELTLLCVFQVTKIYQVIQYWPDNCFEHFGLEVSQARREGDSNPSKAIIAETMKLLGKSSHSAFVHSLVVAFVY